MPKHKISHQQDFFPIKERYEIFDVNLVEKFKIFGQDFVPIRTASSIFLLNFYTITAINTCLSFLVCTVLHP